MPYADPDKRREFYRSYMRRYRARPAVRAAEHRRRLAYRSRQDVVDKERAYSLEYMRDCRKDPERNKRLVESVIKYQQKRRAADPYFRLVRNIRRRLQLAIRSSNNTPSAIRLLGCHVDIAVAHIEARFQPGMTWENYGKWHIDHKRPLVAFDLRDPVQLAEACHYRSLQPLWAKDNQRKGAKV